MGLLGGGCFLDVLGPGEMDLYYENKHRIEAQWARERQSAHDLSGWEEGCACDACHVRDQEEKEIELRRSKKNSRAELMRALEGDPRSHCYIPTTGNVLLTLAGEPGGAYWYWITQAKVLRSGVYLIRGICGVLGWAQNKRPYIHSQADVSWYPQLNDFLKNHALGRRFQKLKKQGGTRWQNTSNQRGDFHE